MSVTKKHIADEIAFRTGLTQVDSVIIIEGLLEAISRALIAGDNIEIRNFGSFKLKKRNAHLARNPRTGEKVEIGEGRKAVFQASRKLKDMVNKDDSAQSLTKM